MNMIVYPTHRRSAQDSLWICDGCGAAEWNGRKPAHECPAHRDAWGKRTMTPMRPATAAEIKAGIRTLDGAA